MFEFKLKRKELLVVYDNYKKEIFDYKGDEIPTNEISRLLDNLEVVCYNHEFISDPEFTTIGRRDFLREEITNYLKEGKYKEALGDFHEYLVDESYNYRSLGMYGSAEIAKKVNDFNDKYAQQGIVCKEDKDIILEIIHMFRDYLKIN